jgi:HlyD family secretion protein
MRSFLRTKVLIGCTVPLILVAAGCTKPEEKEQEPVITVKVAEVTAGPIERIIMADGILRAVDQSAIVPKISAPVVKFYVNRGDHVAKGQLLADLESRDLAAAVADAKGALEQAQATYRNVSAGNVPQEVVKAQQDVRATKQAMDAAQKVLDSRRQLQQQGALAQRLVDEAGVSFAQAQSQYETARQHLESVEGVSRVEDVKAAEAAVASAKAKMDAAEAQLSYAQIHSPVAGVVADRALFPGEMAQAGMPMITVMDVSNVIARVQVPLTQANFVKVGQRAAIQATDGSAQAEGTVTVVSPAVDPNTTTVEIWVKASNPGEKLRPGAAVRVTIDGDTQQNVLLVPVPAVLPASGGGSALMVIKDSVAHEASIETGVRTDKFVQILKGVKKGDVVVVDGGVGLSDGSHVNVEKAGSGGKSEKSDKAEKAGDHD